MPPPGATGGSWNWPQPKPTTAKILSFFRGKRHKSFPWNIESIPADVVLEVNAGIKLDAYSREILHNVLQRQVTISGLQMIG